MKDLEWGVSVIVAPCIGERRLDGDYLWDGVIVLRGGHLFEGTGVGAGGPIVLQRRERQ
ncbi:MAG: hypothetical protein U1E03_11400 [Hyphomonadaceae bacterium]